MTDYRIRIIVEGEDRASGPLGRVGSALGNMGMVAGGIIGAQALIGIARGIIGIGSSAVGATANLQAMEMGMASLMAKEIAMTENARRLAEATENGLKASSVQLLKISDALPQAEAKASRMMEELAKIAIVSPYQLQVVQGSYSMAQAFGYTGEEAMKFTKALLNVGAGVGADNERLSRMAYNLAQIRMIGKVTALDMRQLAMAGFDLNSVLVYVGEQLGLNIKTHDDFNQALARGQISWEQFTELFMKYSEENFGGAAERMSRTLKGLMSTFQDLMILTFPKLLGPAAETFTGFANKILDGFLKIRDSGILETLSVSINNFVKSITDRLSPFVDKFLAIMDALANPFDARMGSTSERASKQFRDQMATMGQDATRNKSKMQAALEGMFGAEGLEKINKVIDAFRKIADAVRPFFTQIADFLTKHVNIVDVLGALGLILLSSVIPALISAAAAIAPFLALVGLIALVRNAWQNNWFGIRDTLTEVWNTTILPALQQLWAWLQVNVPLAIQTLTTYWQTVLLPALQQVWLWIQTNVFPLLQQLWAWLQVNVPLAIQTLATFWQTVLLPAIQGAWAWIQNTLIPTLSELWTWLSTTITQAITTLAGYWQNTLLPAIQAVWSWLDTVLFPFITALNDFLGAVFGLALEVLAGIWQNILYPAIKVVGDYLDATFGPVVEDVGNTISDKLQPVLEWLESFLKGALKAAFAGISKAIQDVTKWLKDMANKIASMKLPDWLTPGSPTPFEIGLTGIADALRDINSLMQPTFGGIEVSRPRGNTAPMETGGDIFIEQNFYDAGAAAIGMAQVASLRRKRLASMGR